MCCKDEHNKDKVLIPLGIGLTLADAEPVEFVRWDDTPLSHKEAAHRFRVWMQNTVAGGFHDELLRELNDHPQG